MPRTINYALGDLPSYHGRYHTGGSIFPDAVRKIMPLLRDKLKSYSRSKIRDLAYDFSQEMDKGEPIKEAVKKSIKKTAGKILTGRALAARRRRRKSQKALKAGKSGKTVRRKKASKRIRTRDYLS
jgi:hypothetical protein